MVSVIVIYSNITFKNTDMVLFFKFSTSLMSRAAAKFGSLSLVRQNSTYPAIPREVRPPSDLQIKVMIRVSTGIQEVPLWHHDVHPP